MSPTSQDHRRPVRSFVRRAGRITAGQQPALDQLWPRWGLPDQPVPLDPGAIFGRIAPCVLEIGFGDGQALLDMAAAHPDWDFIGVEVHEPGIGHCLLGLERSGLTNVRLLSADAVTVLRDRLADGSLARVHLFFPDPWPKKRHHKRRIVQPDFIALVARRLAAGGVLHIATDWAAYAAHVEAVLAASPEFEQLDADPDRPATKFERRGRRLGHDVWDLLYRRR
jgi:tRNA (guanine-N7-)-methyltransferase